MSDWLRALAVLRERVGAPWLDVELAEGAVVADALAAKAARASTWFSPGRSETFFQTNTELPSLGRTPLDAPLRKSSTCFALA